MQPLGGPRRRTLLRSLGAGSLIVFAGCTSILDDGSATPTASDPVTEPTTELMKIEEPLDTEAPTEEPVGTDEPFGTETSEDATGAWPTFRYDAANTGSRSEGVGVTDTPESRWRFRTGDSVYASPTVADGTVYAGTRGGTFNAVDTESGAERWTLRAGDCTGSGAAVADGVVFAGNRDGKRYAFDAADGGVLDTFETDGEIWSPPTVVGDWIYVANRAALVYGIERGGGAGGARRSARSSSRRRRSSTARSTWGARRGPCSCWGEWPGKDVEGERRRRDRVSGRNAVASPR